MSQKDFLNLQEWIGVYKDLPTQDKRQLLDSQIDFGARGKDD